ncbi:uncharacterized protein LOC115015487 isoform X2 [Cottoperca gobio]|uniref:Uncharacterized protein LOC115015487 isoform X2 n=1 Tax=Cottoperca gobio TaxID=56716 RepID=A0A6J2QJW6_COTGO|nr:uncharacterized protein LOC115015487 isoform X2 [Cottoperca gobio]
MASIGQRASVNMNVAEAQIPTKRARMDQDPVSKKTNSAAQVSDQPGFPQYNNKQDYLTWTSGMVSKKRTKTFYLRNPTGARWTWTIGGLDDTIYIDEFDEVKAWNTLYLQKKVSMQVIGVVEGTSCEWDQLVLMTRKNQKLYAFDGEQLHYVASSLKQLEDSGIKYPASKTYYKGDALKHMTKEEWAQMKKSLEDELYESVKSGKSRFLENLRSCRNSLGVPS